MTKELLRIRHNVHDEESDLYWAMDKFCSEEGEKYGELLHVAYCRVHYVVKGDDNMPQTIYIFRYDDHHHYEVLEEIDKAMWLDGTDLEGYDVKLRGEQLCYAPFPAHVRELFIDEVKDAGEVFGTYAIVTNATWTY